MGTEISQHLISQLKDVSRLDKNGRKRALSSTDLEIKGKINSQGSLDRSALGSRLITYGILLVIGLIALYLSATKQFMAAKILFEGIIDKKNSADIQNSQLALLFFGEINAIFSMAIANTLPSHNVKFFGRTLNLSSTICYVWAIVSSTIAIASNVTITIDKYESLKGVAVIAWIETLLPPFAALWVGYTGERLWHVWSTTSNQNRQWKIDPSSHPEYKKKLQDNIIAELYKYGNNRDLLEGNRDLRRLVYNLELAEMKDNLDLFDVTELLSATAMQPSPEIVPGAAVESRPTEHPAFGLAKMQERPSPYLESKPGVG